MGARSLTFSLFSFLFLTLNSQLIASNPSGFDQATMNKVMKGEIVTSIKADTNMEYRAIQRAFFDSVDSETFIKLAVNHPKYADLFDEVELGETLTENSDQTKYTYALDLKIKVGFATFYLEATGQQNIRYAAAADEESFVLNKLTSHKDKVMFLRQNTRLIPHQGGILVEDELHFKMKKSGATNKMIKNFLKDFYGRYIPVVRTELGG